MNFIERLLRKIIKSEVEDILEVAKNNHWETIQSTSGEWYTNTPENITGACNIEIQYNSYKDAYRLKTTGKDPEWHGIYRKMAKAVAKLNAEKIQIQSALDEVKNILN